MLTRECPPRLDETATAFDTRMVAIDATKAVSRYASGDGLVSGTVDPSVTRALERPVSEGARGARSTHAGGR